MEIKYTNSPWIQMQIHPDTWQKIRLAADCQGANPVKWIEEMISSGLECVFSEVPGLGPVVAERHCKAMVVINRYSS